MNIPLLENLTLTAGSHSTREDGMCAMEAAAALAGLPHSDFPPCWPRPIARAFQRVNDAPWASDEERTLFLRPFLARLLSCVDCPGAPITAYGFAAADIAVRVFAPRALRAAGLGALALKLEALAPIVDRATARAADAAAAAAAAAADAADAAAAAYAADAAYAAAAAAAARAAYAAAARAADAAARAAGAAARAAGAAARREMYAQLLTRLLDVHESGQWPLLEGGKQ